MDTKKEQQVIKEIRKIKYGEVRVIIKNGEPVKVYPTACIVLEKEQ